MAGSHCFASCSTCDAHTIGHWAPGAEAPYRLNHSLYHTMGLSGPSASSGQHYGLCDDRLEKMGAGPRRLFEGKAEACDLPSFDRGRACSALSGRQVLIAGDSTAAQLFLSLVLLLGGSFGRNSRHTSALSDITASVCDDTSRLNFVRNDLLLWSTHRSEFNRARECDRLLKADTFIQRAVRDADVLVLQAGHHFPATIEAAVGAGGVGVSSAGFFTRSLNHTLSHLLTARAARGHRPASVVLMGISLPFPGCSRVDRPVSCGRRGQQGTHT